MGGDPSGLNTDRRVQMRHPMSKPRPRRNSDTSIGEDERRRRDRRRPRDSKQPGQKDRPPQTKPSKRLDIIDKLDVTGIYGVGVFHHDGPFDALNPHRNRRLGSKAPMQAFPEGSANNALIGPTADPKAFHNQFLGHAGAGAYADYANGASSDYRVGEKDSRASSTRLTTFNPLSKAELVHGEETLGLGTSTFLDNTPASRAVLQSQEAELASGLNGGGMMRKKSIAQRIRGINRDRAYGFHPSGSMTSPEGPVYRTISETPQSPAEGDPFFNEYGKKEGVTVEEKEVGSEDGQRTEEGDRSRNRAISTPSAASNVRHGLNSSSADMGRDEPRVGSSNGGAPTGGGFLNRVKSLKGRRPR